MTSLHRFLIVLPLLLFLFYFLLHVTVRSVLNLAAFLLLSALLGSDTLHWAPAYHSTALKHMPFPICSSRVHSAFLDGTACHPYIQAQSANYCTPSLGHVKRLFYSTILFIFMTHSQDSQLALFQHSVSSLNFCMNTPVFSKYPLFIVLCWKSWGPKK